MAKGWMSKLIVQNAGEDVNTQIAQIRNLIASKVNLILINPNSATALVPVIKEAQAAGILCIIYDQPRGQPPLPQRAHEPVVLDGSHRRLDGQAAQRPGQHRLHQRHRGPAGQHRA